MLQTQGASVEPPHRLISQSLSLLAIFCLLTLSISEYRRRGVVLAVLRHGGTNSVC